MMLDSVNQEITQIEMESVCEVSEQTGWICDTPEKADWAIEKIKEERARRDLFRSKCKMKSVKVKQDICFCN